MDLGSGLSQWPISSIGDLERCMRDTERLGGRAGKQAATIKDISLEGTSSAKSITAYGEGDGTDSDGAQDSGTIRLEGRTDANLDGSSFKTSGVKVQKGEGCSCDEGECIRAKGQLNARYSVRTKVTLPKVSDYTNLSQSQKKRLQHTINTILAPHEQKHVAAFRKYNGSTSRPFDLTLCKGDFNAAIQSMFDEEEATRRQAAQDESDALDPFFFEFEL